VGQNSKPANYCSNFVYCQPIFITFGTYTLEEIATVGYIASPSNMVYVTALPCKILITTFAICLYTFITINNNKYKKIYTLVAIHVKKQHNKELRHIIEMLSMVIKDFVAAFK